MPTSTLITYIHFGDFSVSVIAYHVLSTVRSQYYHLFRRIDIYIITDFCCRDILKDILWKLFDNINYIINFRNSK